MPINVVDIPRYRRTMGHVHDQLESRLQPRFEDILIRFWRRCAAAVLAQRSVEPIGGDLETELRTALVALYTITARVNIGIVVDTAAQQSTKDWYFGLMAKASKTEIADKMARWIRHNGLSQAKLINRSSMQRARNLIARGIRDGKSLAQIASELSTHRSISRRGLKKYGYSPKKHAKMIVRTEIARAKAEAQQEALAASGLTFKSKAWVHVGDDRVRDTHRTVEGEGGQPVSYAFDTVPGLRRTVGPRGGVTYQPTGKDVRLRTARVPYDAYFIVGGERAQYPHDPRLSAKETINCRCSLAVFEEGVPRKGRPRNPSKAFPETDRGVTKTGADDAV